jgi:hypothetical protein
MFCGIILGKSRGIFMATNLDNQLLSRNDSDASASAGAANQTATDETKAASPTLRETVLEEKRKRAIQAQKTSVTAATASTSDLVKKKLAHKIKSLILRAMGIPPLPEMIENMIFSMLGLAVIFLLVLNLSIVTMIVGAISNPLGAIKTVFGVLWGQLSGSK